MNLPAIRIPDLAVARAARERVDTLTKPLGSLGRIEELAVRLCAIAGGIPPHRYERRAILIGAGDHGVTREGVSAYPAEVTPQMVGGFCAGTAAINAFARAVRAEVFVADFGVAAALPSHPRLFDLKVAPGTENLARGPAIERAGVERALAAGFEAFRLVAAAVSPLEILALGEMGIGNTTPAAALVAAFTKTPAGLVVGRGTGVDDATFARKTQVVERAVARLGNESDPFAIASELGGYEIVGLAGTMLAAAAASIPIVLDGFIVAAAALLARALVPNVAGYLFASHRSQEAGHRVALRALGLEPLFDLDLRLGEASGAALALPIVEAAARMVAEMKTFAEAGVSAAVAVNQEPLVPE
ncbi:MAG: nicotinate-nucleotide--dimethylbenzimidazole phosphoribosyltransferase [Candidatus Eremiobacteraeota bacterium]|nr:nicotinate-nucleotide--dimethylbenzimidazole phosphoribosyltransferase [Candidatus Eremiobacteraeota bacterium]